MNSPSFEAKFEDIFEKNHLLFSSSKLDLGYVAISGARGVLGNAISRYLLRLKEDSILSFDKLQLLSRAWPTESRNSWNEKQELEFIENVELEKVIEKVDTVLHCASPSNITKIFSYEQLWDVNVRMLHRLLKFNPVRVLFVSSSEVYGNSENARETDNLGDFSGELTRNWYPRAKIAAEQVLEEFCLAGDGVGAIVRLFHTFGPGLKRDDGRSFSDIMWEATERKRITLKSSGEQVRTFAYLEDSVKAIMGIIYRDQTGTQIFNVGSEEKHSILDFASKVSSLTGASIVQHFDPEFIHSPRNVICPNIEKLKLLGWRSEWDIESAIEKTVRWMKM